MEGTWVEQAVFIWLLGGYQKKVPRSRKGLITQNMTTKAMTKIGDAQKHAHSLANEALAKLLVEGGVGKMLTDLAMMRPYLLELSKRFTHLKKGEDILGYTSIDGEKGFCLGEIGRTYRACKYAMHGGNKDRKPTVKKPTPKLLTAGTPENKTENVSVSTPVEFIPVTVLVEGMIIAYGGEKFMVDEIRWADRDPMRPTLSVLLALVGDAPKDPVVAPTEKTNHQIAVNSEAAAARRDGKAGLVRKRKGVERLNVPDTKKALAPVRSLREMNADDLRTRIAMLEQLEQKMGADEYSFAGFHRGTALKSLLRYSNPCADRAMQRRNAGCCHDYHRQQGHDYHRQQDSTDPKDESRHHDC